MAAKYVKNLPKLVAAACKKLEKGTSEPWKKRFKAIKDLEDLLLEGQNFSESRKLWHGYQNMLVKPFQKTITDLRSELVRQCAHTLAVFARELTTYFKRTASKILPQLIEVASSRNNTIRTNGQNCVMVMLQHCQSKPILFTVLDALNGTKDKLRRTVCMKLVHTILAFWDMNKFSRYAQVIEDAVGFGMKCPSPQTRNMAVKCFWLFVGHFPDRHDAFLAQLDARSRRLIERGGRTIEEEEQEYNAATKIGATFKGFLTRRRVRTATLLGKSVQVGQRVTTLEGNHSGVCRFVGEVDGRPGNWVGVELDEPVGNCNGLLGSDQLFQCAPNHGKFLRVIAVVPEKKKEAPVPCTRGWVDLTVVQKLALTVPEHDEDSPHHEPVTPKFSFKTKDPEEEEDEEEGQSQVPEVKGTWPENKPTKLKRPLPGSSTKKKKYSFANLENVLPMERPRGLTLTPIVPVEEDELTAENEEKEKDALPEEEEMSAEHLRQKSFHEDREMLGIAKDHYHHIRRLRELLQLCEELHVRRRQVKASEYLKELHALLTEEEKSAGFLKKKTLSLQARLQRVTEEQDSFLDEMDMFHKFE